MRGVIVSWLTAPSNASENLHVLPIDDSIGHEPTDDSCVCVPRVEPVERPDGSFGWLYVHASLDGRELLERRKAV